MKTAIETLKKAVANVSKNLDESSFTDDKTYWHEMGYADGLSSALHLLQELEKGTDAETALRMAVDLEDE